MAPRWRCFRCRCDCHNGDEVFGGLVGKGSGKGERNNVDRYIIRRKRRHNSIAVPLVMAYTTPIWQGPHIGQNLGFENRIRSRYDFHTDVGYLIYLLEIYVAYEVYLRGLEEAD